MFSSSFIYLFFGSYTFLLSRRIPNSRNKTQYRFTLQSSIYNAFIINISLHWYIYIILLLLLPLLQLLLLTFIYNRCTLFITLFVSFLFIAIAVTGPKQNQGTTWHVPTLDEMWDFQHPWRIRVHPNQVVTLIFKALVGSMSLILIVGDCKNARIS